MILITASQITKSYGVNTVLEEQSFKIEKGEKIALLGANGAGKTTLFRLLTGEESVDSGAITINSDLKIAYVQQQQDASPDKTAIEEVLGAFLNLIDMEKKLFDMQKKLEDSPTAELMEAYQFLSDAFVREGGLTYKSRAESALLGLGFVRDEMERSLSLLSGGQRTKVLLARALLAEADLLLLDEPTNHLDIAAIGWLENFLKVFKGTLLVTSHDRYFIDVVTNKIFEIDKNKIHEYKGNYSYYISKKETDNVFLKKDYELKQKEIKRLEGIITQQKQWNREKNIKTAESKQKVIDKIQENMEKPESAALPIQFDFSVKTASGKDVLLLEEISKSFGSAKLFEKVDMFIRRGDRVFLLGENGCGKTTLFKIILGHETYDEGFVRLGVGVKIGYYKQTQDDLVYSKTIFDEVSDAYPSLDNTKIRNTLAAFLFKGDDVFKRIIDLSGGEKARVTLAKLMLSGANLLMMDEPTNHLDIKSKEVLEKALLAYDGTMLIISHDRYFINKLASRVCHLTSEGIRQYDGNYDEYLLNRSLEKEKIEPDSGGFDDYKAKKEAASQKRKLVSKIARTESLIESKEEDVNLLKEKVQEPEFSSDYEKLMEITKETQKAELELAELYGVWDTLTNELLEWDTDSKEKKIKP